MLNSHNGGPAAAEGSAQKFDVVANSSAECVSSSRLRKFATEFAPVRYGDPRVTIVWDLCPVPRTVCVRKCEPRWPWFAVVSGIGHERISDFRRRRRRSNLLFSSLSLGLLVPTGSCRLRRSTFVDDQQQQEEEEEEINEKKEENKKK